MGGAPPDRRVGALDLLVATGVSIHMEHLDRNCYYLGLARLARAEEEGWAIHFHAHGYIRTRCLSAVPPT